MKIAIKWGKKDFGDTEGDFISLKSNGQVIIKVDKKFEDCFDMGADWEQITIKRSKAEIQAGIAEKEALVSVE